MKKLLAIMLMFVFSKHQSLSYPMVVSLGQVMIMFMKILFFDEKMLREATG